MSCNIDINLKVNIHEAALVRAYLFLQTKQDSYEFPSTRTVIIRKFIQNLDEQIEANLPEEDHPDEHAYDPLTPEEVNDAAKEFFPLFDIVHRSMPENCTVEDTIKVMETVCQMAQKRRAFDKGEVGPFGFNKKPEENEEKEDINT